MDKEFEKKYHELEKKHFWFKSRRKYIVDLLKSLPKDSTILDIGSSSGILLNELKDEGFNSENLYGIDISEEAIKNCKENGIENAFVMDAQNITLDKKFDVIIASDCLEHLEQDKKALTNWKSLLKDNGKLYVFVPAYMFLWSEHDTANMHFRRYTKSELVNKLSETGFTIKKSSYWNFFLFFPISLVRLAGRLKSSKTQKENHSLEGMPPANGLFYQLINFENKLLKGLSFPFGVSTFCIATKK